VETKDKPIEVRLSQPNLEVTCRIVLHDGTAIGVGVDAPSIGDAQREMTTWLAGHGYEPAGRWSTKDGNGSRATRTFRQHDGQASAGVFAVVQQVPPPVERHEPDLDPPLPPAPPAASRVRRPAAPGITASGEPRHSPQAAETRLRAWARAHAERDDVIREADAAGIGLHRINEITGIAPTLILRILGSPPRRAPRKVP